MVQCPAPFFIGLNQAKIEYLAEDASIYDMDTGYFHIPDDLSETIKTAGWKLFQIIDVLMRPTSSTIDEHQSQRPFFKDSDICFNNRCATCDSCCSLEHEVITTVNRFVHSLLKEVEYNRLHLHFSGLNVALLDVNLPFWGLSLSLSTRINIERSQNKVKFYSIFLRTQAVCDLILQRH